MMKQARKWRWQDALGWLALATLILATAAHLLTRPPAMPAYETVRADWKPSEAWLYDRDGRLLDSERVDFERRRLAWVPLKDISPDVRDMVVAAEDHRFWSHGGVDWLAMASAIRTRWTGGRSRGASTLPMQLAAFLAPRLLPEMMADGGQDAQDHEAGPPHDEGLVALPEEPQPVLGVGVGEIIVHDDQVAVIVGRRPLLGAVV